MKKYFKRIFASFLVVVFLLSTSSISAFARSSEQINTYGTNATVLSGGKIYISFSITGKGTMSEIGASSISIAKSVGGLWVTVKSYDSDDDGMTKTNANRCSGAITYSGTAGTYYRIKITVFATDSSGTDSRTEIHYVTATA
ncbi:MAG: hypothetical protein LUC39_08250 [Clostridiales bacterium]|nr:hypothetical protein [Clostridiales bacterium]